MSFMKAIDHLVLAGPDLGQLEQWWKDVSGISAHRGGIHEGRGTRNALVGIDQSTYLELIGPDPEQDHPGPMPFGLDSMDSIRLATFALAVTDLESAVAAYTESGVELNPVETMSRRQADGTVLEWSLAFPSETAHGGVVPFLIEWADSSPHPSQDLDRRVDLVRLELTHPEPDRIQNALSTIVGSDVDISVGPPALAAVFGTLRGPVVVATDDGG